MRYTKERIPVFLTALLLLVCCLPVMAFGETASKPSGTHENAVQEIVISNTPIKGIIQLEKQGPVLTGFNEHQDPFGNVVHTPIYGNGWLEGAVFEIHAVEDIIGKDGTVWFKANELADTIVTTREQMTASKPLPLGHYYLQEVFAPDGYLFEKTRYDVVLEAKDQETPTVTVSVTAHNDFMPTRVSLIKEKEILSTQKDQDGMTYTDLKNVPGEGFVFGLYNAQTIPYADKALPANTLIATAVSDKQGKLSFHGKLPVGNYYLQEISGPEGWELDDTQHGISLPADAKIADREMTVHFEKPIVNRLIQTEVAISKTDLTGSDYLPHTMIRIRNAKGETVLEGYTGEDGYLPSFPAVPGDYTFREVLAPEGYELCVTDIAFKVNPDGTIEGSTAVADDFTRFSIQKVDKWHEPLSGVEFGLFREDGTQQATAISDDKGLATFEKIPYGSYVIRETKALPGYLKNNTEVSITVDGTFVNPTEPIAVLENCETEILLQKVDSHGVALKGAYFGLFDADGAHIMTAISDDAGLAHFIGVPYGSYTIRELSAPAGYLLSHGVISITVDEGYTNPDEPVAVIADQEKKLLCIKTDTSGKPIAGVSFSLLNAETMEAVETTVSDDNGAFTFTRFDYGDWIIREDAAPEGFCAMADLQLHIDDSWKDSEPILCVNIPDHYEFKKTDSSGNPLKGVKFRLEDEAGTELGIYESGEDGLVKITGLKPGVYLIRETETLKGYTLSGEVIKLKVDEYFTVPEKPRQFVNYTTIQTGVNLAVTGILWAGFGLMAVSGTVGLVRKRRQRKAE